MSALSAAQLAEVTRLTGLSSEELNDLISLPKVQQATAIQGYRNAHAAWIQNHDTVKDVIAALELVMSVAGGVGTVAGGILSVVSLLRLL